MSSQWVMLYWGVGQKNRDLRNRRQKRRRRRKDSSQRLGLNQERSDGGVDGNIEGGKYIYLLYIKLKIHNFMQILKAVDDFIQNESHYSNFQVEVIIRDESKLGADSS